MIRGLAIETSGKLGSVAITEDGIVLAEDTFAHGLKHAAEMVPRIDHLLKAAGWQPADVREIYVSVGPGSFTGLRIGITPLASNMFEEGLFTHPVWCAAKSLMSAEFTQMQCAAITSGPRNPM